MTDDCITHEQRLVAVELDVKKIRGDIEELLLIFGHAKNGVAFIVLLAKFAKWVGGVLAATVAIWAAIYALIYAFKTGHPPPS